MRDRSCGRQRRLYGADMSIAGPAYELYGVSVFGTGPIADGVHVPLK